jgi:hypothetical protein
MAKAPKTKKPGLDIKDEMYWTDKKKFDWLSNQTDEMAKTFSPLIAMKWQSVVPDYSKDYEHYLTMVNEAVNMGFWDLSRHPDLQWRLMCSVGSGNVERHGWIPLAKSRKKLGKVDTLLLKWYPHLNDEELTTLKSKFTPETFKRFMLDLAMSDQDIKPILDEFKARHG